MRVKPQAARVAKTTSGALTWFPGEDQVVLRYGVHGISVERGPANHPASHVLSAGTGSPCLSQPVPVVALDTTAAAGAAAMTSNDVSRAESKIFILFSA